jgi:hypothetical protein
MDADKIVQMRYILDQIKVHPAWNVQQREAMMDIFNLDEDDLDMLHSFIMWVQNHELEYAYDAYKTQP